MAHPSGAAESKGSNGIQQKSEKCKRVRKDADTIPK